MNPAGGAKLALLTTLKMSIVGSITNSSPARFRSEEHTSELQSQSNLVSRPLLEKKKEWTLLVRSTTIQARDTTVRIVQPTVRRPYTSVRAHDTCVKSKETWLRSHVMGAKRAGTA